MDTDITYCVLGILQTALGCYLTKFSSLYKVLISGL